MTNNFSILTNHDFSNFRMDFIDKINEIEKKIKEKDLNYIYLEGRKILEKLLSEEDNSNLKLESKIQQYCRQNSVPLKVKDAFFFVKTRGNEDAHVDIFESDIPFQLERDIFSAIEFLKRLFIIFKYFVQIRVEDGEEIIRNYNFDSSIYLPKEKQILEAENDLENIDLETDEIKSNLKGLAELISHDYRFLIPTYQRDYSWKKENVEILMQDIMDRIKDKEIHYMGSLALAVNREDNILRLIDGQQRITTALLMLKAIIERYKNTKKIKIPEEVKNIADKLGDKYINQGDTYGPLSHVKTILTKHILSTNDKDFVKSNAFQNYQLMLNKFKEMGEQYFDKFVMTFILYFKVAELRFNNDLDREIEIFENLNSKGMELSQWDLIKNHIFKSIELNLLKKNEKDIEKFLNKSFIFKASEIFGEKEKNKKLSKFFEMYCRVKYKLINDKILQDKGKIHKIFRDLWNKNKSKITSLEELEERLEFIAKCFEIFWRLESKEFNNSTSPLFELNLHLMNCSAKDVHFPLIINSIILGGEWNGHQLIKIKRENLEKLKIFIGDIDKYITRLIVVKNAGQSLSNLFDRSISSTIDKAKEKFHKEIVDGNAELNALPSWKDFYNELKSKNDWQKEYALAVLRTLEFNRNSILNKQYTIIIKPSLEHIFPVKVNEESIWYQDYKISNGSSFRIFQQKQKSKINKLGNYLILTTALNSKVSNKNFITKREKYKSLDTQLIFGLPNNLLMDLTLKNSFTFDDIDIRTRELAELIAPLYKLSIE